ncbi:hypothetical protein SRB5_09110 [Streptomyces sp. RB5]|uniref:Epoxide hydrolase n=1 Tax=Streptomyces smaragdinus TaxID=2585196 RepID=A0A7K0CBJ9_9ACTN|nr:hypothetical protein [Streptomyces smaragdinus]MQY10798.1 hypothetical protein [Streptomyces smaragdinus]
MAAHLLDGQTLAHGLNDSPAGTLAWVLKRWKTWSDRNADFEAGWPAEDILTFATIYWATESIGSSIRAYKNAGLYPARPVNDIQPYVQAPASFTFLVGDPSPGADTPEERVALFRAGGARFYGDIRDVNAHEKGGHFGPYENPDAWIHDLRAGLPQAALTAQRGRRRTKIEPLPGVLRVRPSRRGSASVAPSPRIVAPRRHHRVPGDHRVRPAPRHGSPRPRRSRRPDRKRMDVTRHLPFPWCFNYLPPSNCPVHLGSFAGRRKATHGHAHGS